MVNEMKRIGLRTRHRRIIRGAPVSVALILILLYSIISFSQVAGGSIAGLILDPSGAVLENAQVQVQEKETGITVLATTNSAGVYVVPNLRPGKYSVTATAKGFSGSKADDISVIVGTQQQINLTLALASASQTVEVEAATTGVNLSTSSISGEVSGERIRELPLNGRDWTQLATLEPGVSTIRNQASIGSNGSSDATKATRGFGTQLSISGTRSNQNNYRLDGISFNDYTNDAPGGVLGTLSGVDAIQEFSVLTTNYSAEYGRTSGGVINAVTRGGSNSLHGDVYEFLRNSALDSRGYFDGPRVPPFRRNQFGAAVGGPIVQNKTFFFFSYEGIRQQLSTTHNSFVLSRNARQGIFANGDVRSVDPAVAPYLSFYPLPNGAENGDLGLYSVATLQQANQNFFTGKLDHKFSDRDRISGTFLLDRTNLSEPDQLNNEHFQQRNSRPFASIEETHSFGNLVNSVRFGFSRNHAQTATADPINQLVSDTTLGSVPGRPAAQITIGGGVAPFFGGIGAFPQFTFGWNSYQLYDDAFLTHNKHAIKFGFALERMQSNNHFFISQNGGFKFNTVEDFITNNPARFSTYVGTPSGRNIRETVAAGYIQDDWRWRSNLTLNLGLRYEAATVPSEVNGRLSSLTSMTGSELHTGNPYFSNPTLRNFEPRIGFAWDPFKTGKTSVRGGFGLYDVLPLPYEFLIISSNAAAPFSANISVSPGAGSFPNAYPAALASFEATGLATQRVAYVEANPKRSYVNEWNLNIEHEFARNVVATVAYVGSRGIHLPYRTDDADIVIPTKTSAGYVWPTNGTVINPNVGRIDRLTTDGDSYYHALQTGLKLRPARALQLQASYTWGKSIDTGSSTIGGDQYTNSPSSLPLWFDPATRRGLSDFNLGQNLVINGIWTLPRAHSIPSSVSWAVNGWQIGGIVQASSGAPFSVLLGGDPLDMGGTDPYDYPDRISSSACSSLVNPGNVAHYIKTECFAAPSQLNRLGNAGRNALTGPGLFNTDLAFYKNNAIPGLSEKFNIQFRAEIFNVLNHPNFAPPISSNVLFNQNGSAVASAGQLTALQTPARQIQFGLKVIW